MKYFVVLPSNILHMDNLLEDKRYGNVRVVRHTIKGYGVLDLNDNEIVPLGLYSWIDGFDENGLARVNNRRKVTIEELQDAAEQAPETMKKLLLVGGWTTALWGIIDEEGDVVLAPIYDQIWNFLGKGRRYTKVIKGKEEKSFDLKKRLFKDDPSYPYAPIYKKKDIDNYEDYDNYDDCYSTEDYARDGWDMIAGDAGIDGDYDIDSLMEYLGMD